MTRIVKGNTFASTIANTAGYFELLIVILDDLFGPLQEHIIIGQTSNRITFSAKVVRLALDPQLFFKECDRALRFLTEIVNSGVVVVGSG